MTTSWETPRTASPMTILYPSGTSNRMTMNNANATSSLERLQRLISTVVGRQLVDDALRYYLNSPEQLYTKPSSGGCEAASPISCGKSGKMTPCPSESQPTTVSE